MINDYAALCAKIVAEHAAYAVKPTKASSKRLRDLINQAKKLATPTRTSLIEADKAV